MPPRTEPPRSRGGGDREERPDRARQRRNRVADPVGEHRAQSRRRCPARASCRATQHRDLTARKQPNTKGDKDDADHHGDVRQITLHGRGRRHGQEAESAEHGEESGRHRGGGRHRAGHGGASINILAPHHQGQIRGQHGEATWVQRRQQASAEGQAHQVLVHGARRPSDSAATRSDSSWVGMAAVGLFTNVDEPSAR